MCASHDHGQGGDVWDVVFLGILLPLGLFWPGGNNGLVIAKPLHQCLKKV